MGDTNPPQKFDTGLDLKTGDRVIMETAEGANWGVVDSAPVTARENSDNLQIMRKATDSDNKIIDKLVNSAVYALKAANERVIKYKLEMKLLSAAYTFDSNKVIIQFYSENRVDFREFVKDLAYALRTRIELRQVGARDEVKIVGAMGQCGMPCCCGRFIENFDNVTIKMAKNQNISLNPQKINGMCGRLLCCLGYENKYYSDMQDKMPRYGSEIDTPDGRGIAQDSNMLKETVNVKFQNNESVVFKNYKVSDLKYKQTNKSDN